MKTSTKTKQLLQLSWHKRDANCFVCVDEAEIYRSKRGEPWVVLIPFAYTAADGKSWGLLQDNGKSQAFKRAREAMAAAEMYLHIFRQFHQSGEDFVELNAGNLRPAGSHD